MPVASFVKVFAMERRQSGTPSGQTQLHYTDQYVTYLETPSPTPKKKERKKKKRKEKKIALFLSMWPSNKDSIYNRTSLFKKKKKKKKKTLLAENLGEMNYKEWL